ncbi:transposase [Geotalea uraniireducens]|uniref:Transposase n=1 Tax=Geotalea uraniireducens TaxID=351604 RepID=A0ABM8EPN2_9BACT|nr:transposase [Geotalea uraniireducens]BDV44563.1 transposase [Geotalea uraniireducens]
MPRQARIDGAGTLHHIICRGIERREIFTDDSDRDDFVLRMGTILAETSTRCYAWALILNHFHLLLQTGTVPVATVMRRLLTGYATKFNRRHGRHGHLFQNRYKSILCQEEPYLLELVRYIHLNPLRAGVVSSLEELREHRYCGNSRIFARNGDAWFAAHEILGRFGKRPNTALQAYEAFITDGVAHGRRDDLTGGGLFRSSGGWSAVISARAGGIFLKSDERILGDSDFVERILESANEEMEKRARYFHLGCDLEKLVLVVAGALGINPAEVEAPGRQPQRVEARSLFCYWAVRELGSTSTALAKRLGLTQPAVSLTVGRGERFAAERGWRLDDFLSKALEDAGSNL